jgi:hypothetical protein
VLAGRPGSSGRAAARPAAEVVAADWAAAIGCPVEPSLEPVPGAPGGLPVERLRWTAPGRPGVELTGSSAVGHGRPGRPQCAPARGWWGASTRPGSCWTSLGGVAGQR